MNCNILHYKKANLQLTSLLNVQVTENGKCWKGIKGGQKSKQTQTIQQTGTHIKTHSNPVKSQCWQRNEKQTILFIHPPTSWVKKERASKTPSTGAQGKLGKPSSQIAPKKMSLELSRAQWLTAQHRNVNSFSSVFLGRVKKKSCRYLSIKTHNHTLTQSQSS